MTAKDVLLWEVFDIDLDTAAEIDAKLFKLAAENGINAKTVKSIINRYSGNKLAYAMFQYGKIYCATIDNVSELDPLAAEIRSYLRLSLALKEKEIANILRSFYGQIVDYLTKKTAEHDPQFF